MAPLSRMLQTCYTGGTGRYTKRGDTMTGHALTRIYTAPKQQPADTTHRPPISIHVSQKPPAPPPPPRGLGWGRRALGDMGSRVYIRAREKARPDPACCRTRTGLVSFTRPDSYRVFLALRPWRQPGVSRVCPLGRSVPPRRV